MADFNRAARQHARQRNELDACGIGFVAHASGGTSREIVDLALTGLACVRHRQAIAADGLTVTGAAGQVRPNPLLATEDALRKSIIAHVRTLRLTGATEY